MTSEVDFYWDIGSTNTYFAFKLLPGVLQQTGASVRYHPLNLGYVFRHYNYTLMDEPREKLRYRRRDLERWAEHYGLPFRMPDKFPIKTSRALRGALAMRRLGKEQPYLDALFAAYWENNIAVDEYDNIVPLAESLGIDGDDFTGLAESGEIKAELVDMTGAALARGIFGAPTFVVGEEIFWGKDRMDFLERELALASAAG